MAFDSLLVGLLPIMQSMVNLLLYFAIFAAIFWLIDKVTPKKVSSSGRRRRRKTMFVVAIVGLTFVSFMSAPMMAIAADGTVGEMEVSTSMSIDDMNVCVRFTKLAVSSAYGVELEGVSILNFTTGSSETTKIFFIQVSQPSDEVATIELVQQSTGTMIDQRDIYIPDLDDIAPQQPIIEVMVLIAILTIIGSVLVRMRGRLVNIF